MGKWLVVVLSAWILGSAEVGIAGGLDKPAFSATPEELLAEAARVNRDASAIVLRDEITTTIDEAGRAEHRTRVVFVIKKPAAVDSWGTLSLDWSPFYQDKPVVRVRVIGPDKQIAELDQTLITDAPTVSESPSVFSDRRKLEAPIPRLSIGSVIEEELVIKDREPLLPAGTANLIWIGRGVPVERTLVTVSAPTARKVRVVARAFAKPPSPRHGVDHGRTTWVYDLGPMDARKEEPVGVPGDDPFTAYIGWSTAASWSAVADDYRRIVDKRLADGATTLPTQLKAASERETVDRTVAWLHEHVRYTGIEFSDAAIVPWTPDDVLKRGFGDCKDKATLLVAMLRAAGVRADVVLVSTGPGWDLDRELPGMGVFDHAIVRAKVAGKDLWIDATEDTLLAGQLPARDQARHALVIGEGTRDLVVTPASLPAENTIREIRTYHLAEYQTAELTEITEESGVFVDGMRTWIRDTKREDITKYLTKRVERDHHAKLTGFSSSDPNDVTRPFKLTVEMTKVKRAFADREQIDVYLFSTDTFGRVPAVFDEDKTETDTKVKERTADYAWYRPHVYEIENHLEIPPGYDVPQLVAKEQQALGTMTLTTTRIVGAKTIVITYRLDTGKARLSPAELFATRAATRELWKHEGEHVVFVRTSAALIHRGKLKEAIAECQRMIALHPKEALHHDQLAEAYRLTGMGEAARRAARKGVEVEPTSADGFAMLAWELRHGSLGREFGEGSDRKGALAAYRKAIVLNPKHMGAFADLAQVLSRDDRGALAEDKRDQLEAIAMWRRAKEVGETESYDVAIASELLAAGDLVEAEKAARTLPESDERGELVVAAVALSRGSNEAIAMASSVTSADSRKRVLDRVAHRLVGFRRYDLMRPIFAEARTSSTDPNVAALYDKLAIVDLAKLDPADPKTPALQMNVLLAGVPVAHTPWDAAMSRDLEALAITIRGLVEMKVWKQLTRPSIADILAAVGDTQVDGNAADGWRLASLVSGRKSVLYLTAEHGKARLVGNIAIVQTLGRYLQEQLAKGNVAGAARFLKRVTPDLSISGSTIPLASLVKLVDSEPTPSKEVIELAAAIFLAKSQPNLALPVLKRCAPSGEDIKKTCRTARMAADLEARTWSDLDATAREAADADPTALEASANRIVALMGLGRLDEAYAVLDHGPFDATRAARMRAYIALVGPWQDAQPKLDALEALSNVTVEDLNTLAWTHLFHDPDPTKAKELGVRAERMSAKLPRNVLNTLAAVAVEAGDPYDAWQYLVRSFDAGDGTPENGDWYVIGRIAEAYGLADDAIAAYKRVVKPKSDLDVSAYDFAQRGLKRLGVRT